MVLDQQARVAEPELPRETRWPMVVSGRSAHGLHPVSVTVHAATRAADGRVPNTAQTLAIPIGAPDQQAILQLLEEGLHRLSETVMRDLHSYHIWMLDALGTGAQVPPAQQPQATDCDGQASERGQITQPEELSGEPHEFDRSMRQRERERFPLTDQEIEILRLVAAGLTSKEISAHQFWSEITIKRKIQEIHRKLGVKSRAQAVAEAIRLGLI